MQSKAQEIVAFIDHVSKDFNTKKAVIDVSINIHRGEILSILGPNGAGKTTLINMMLGRLSLSRGNMSLFGLQPGSIELKRQCGAMLQVSSLPDMSTVKEHIQLFQSYYSNPMNYQQVIDFSELKEIENNYSKNLSGGQKQRLLFALSICGNPKLLFLDEPTVGLDIKARKSLWRTISELKKQGTSIVLTTHYLEEADQLSDQIIMLNQGRIIQQGTPAQIKSQVATKTIRFVSSIAKYKLLKLPAVVQVEQSGDFFEIITKDPVITLRKIFDISKDVEELTVSGTALEDAFLQLNQADNSTSHAA